MTITVQNSARDGGVGREVLGLVGLRGGGGRSGGSRGWAPRDVMVGI